MARRSWGQVLWPQHAPLWLVILGNLSLVIVIGSITLTALPKSMAKMLPKVVRRLRNKLLGYGRHVAELSAQGPFYRLMVYCGRRLSGGYIATHCKAPKATRAKAGSCSDVQVTFAPVLPINPWHQEDYIVAWRRVDSKADESKWFEKFCQRDADSEDLGDRLKVVVDGVPERVPIKFRVCAVNVWGRGEWSNEAVAETLARPSEAGGSDGPMGPAAAGSGWERYQWGQTHNEVTFKVPIGDRKAKDIKLKAFPTRLEIRCAEKANGSDELLVGPLARKVKADEVFWSVEDEDKELGRHLAVQMAKAELMEKWPCLIEAEGHARIDTRLLRLFTEGMGSLGNLDIWE